MARLPQASDLRRRTAPALSQAIRGPDVDYSAARTGTNALTRGLDAVGGAIDAQIKQTETDLDYETQKRLLDFKLETETALEEYKRTMPQGGSGYAAGWQGEYIKRAKAFVGKEDANVPAHLRGRIGLELKQHETALYERAARDELAEKDRTEVEGLEQTLGVTRSFVEADPGRRDEMLLEGESLIEKSRLSPAIKDATKKKFAKELDKTAIVTRIMKAQTFEDYQALQRDLAPEAPDRRSSSVVTDKITAGRAGKPSGWAATNPIWAKLDGFQKAAAMSLMEADGMSPEDAKNVLGAIINRAAKNGEEIGAHVSQKIYQPTIEPSQEKRLSRILLSPKFAELTEWAKRRADGQEPDPVNGATHFLAPERTMLALESGNPAKYRSWRKWTGFNGKEYNGVILRDGSHAFLAPEGAAETAPMEAGEGYSGPYSRLTLPERKALWTQAETQRRKAVVEVAKEVTALEKNAILGYRVPEVDALAEKVRATGEQALVARFDSAVQRADIFSTAQRRPPAENQAMLREFYAVAAQSPPSPEAVQTLQQFEKLVSEQTRMVKTDKLTWAHRSGSAEVGPLDFSDDESMRQRLQAAASSTMQFGGPIQYFTKGERDAFAAKLKAGGDGLIQMTSRMAAIWGPEHTVNAMREISDKAPEAAVAGYLLSSNINPKAASEIATTLQRRQDPSYRPMVLNKAKSEPLAVEVLQDVYRNFPPQQRDAILTAADALYEARISGKDANTDGPDIYKQAVRDVIGQRTDARGNVYGGPVSGQRTWWGMGGYANEKMFLLPPTWRADTWKDVLEGATPRDLLTAGMVPPADSQGKPLSMTRIANAHLVQVGPGQYQVAMGDPDTPGQEQWVMTMPMPRRRDMSQTETEAPNTGTMRRPFILDLNRLETVMRPRAPGAFWGE